MSDRILQLLRNSNFSRTENGVLCALIQLMLSPRFLNAERPFQGCGILDFFHLPTDKLDFIFYLSAAYVHLPK